ncbi:hypothetical protein [Marinivivus vitaminiproducens]|uniref:hypothetical protein n=1 Tax=Marinivivus vitaminiproducens TaxID=3035935 RepID=UPI0027A18D8D|nr:hypothetical protein P4R82_23600 [Geminicoccaceae bacterium SCSIO 64248]WGF90920.1 hypothetical protein P4R82_24255 [Geminicoccaceae bacterium SCSIO 64248]
MRVTRTSALVIAGLMVASTPDRADPVALDLQHRHPSGLVPDFTGIETTATEVRLDLGLVNGSPSVAILHPSDTASDVTIGNAVLYLVPVQDNATMTVEPHSTAKGRLVFFGLLPNEAGPLHVVLNERGSSSATTPTPLIELDIPAEIVAASRQG